MKEEKACLAILMRHVTVISCSAQFEVIRSPFYDTFHDMTRAPESILSGLSTS